MNKDLTIPEDIVITYVYPAIPIRDFDWAATRQSYEPGNPIGRGATVKAALEDLLAQEAEKN